MKLSTYNVIIITREREEILLTTGFIFNAYVKEKNFTKVAEDSPQRRIQYTNARKKINYKDLIMRIDSVLITREKRFD